MGVAKKEHKSKGLGLDSIGDLSELLNVVDQPEKGPMMIPLDLIDEDPNQPRTESNPGFSKESLSELAVTIKQRGIKSPISVRKNPDDPNRFIINHGARRYRASKIAGMTEIPAFIDNDYLEDDQIIENIQRNELTAREIAEHIGKKLSNGMKKGDIAKSIGKSPAFITQHATLLDLPEPIAEVFNTGRAKDVTVVNELVTAYKNAPDEVEAWLNDDTQELTRGSVKLLREFLEDKEARDPNTVDAFTSKTDSEGAVDDEEDKPPKAQKEPDPEKLKKAIVQVMHDKRSGRLILNRRPPAEGFAWIKYDDDGHEFEANLVEVTLVALMEG